MVAAAAMANGGDGGARVRYGERAEEGKEHEREVEGGGCVPLGADSSSGKQAGGGRGTCSRALATRSSSWGELGDDWHGQPARPPG